MYLVVIIFIVGFVFFFKQKTAYEMRISDWSSDVCSSDLKLLVNFAQFGLNGNRTANEDSSHLCRHNTIGIALEQDVTKFIFGIADTTGHGGLRYAELPACRA